MERSRIREWAERGLRMPVGADLVLREEPDPERVRLDARLFSRVLERAARRYETPLAVGLMDLRLEKAWLTAALGIPEAEADGFHFSAPPTPRQVEQIRAAAAGPLPPRMQAHVDALRDLAGRCPDLAVCGMSIGPFSLMTKLLADPITPVFLAGSGVRGAEDPEVETAERCLELASCLVERSIQAQVEAGVALLFLAEPAANRVFFSPNQMEAGSDIFERFALAPNRRIRKQLGAAGVHLLFHDCGELTDAMIRGLASLDPAILSLGSARPLWEAVPLVPETTVLFGNLPSKKFVNDQDLSVETVRRMTRELIARMREAGRPFILGTECDVLHVQGREAAIRAKIEAMRTA